MRRSSLLALSSPLPSFAPPLQLAADAVGVQWTSRYSPLCFCYSTASRAHRVGSSRASPDLLELPFATTNPSSGCSCFRLCSSPPCRCPSLPRTQPVGYRWTRRATPRSNARSSARRLVAGRRFPRSRRRRVGTLPEQLRRVAGTPVRRGLDRWDHAESLTSWVPTAPLTSQPADVGSATVTGRWVPVDPVDQSTGQPLLTWAVDSVCGAHTCQPLYKHIPGYKRLCTHSN